MSFGIFVVTLIATIAVMEIIKLEKNARLLLKKKQSN